MNEEGSKNPLEDSEVNFFKNKQTQQAKVYNASWEIFVVQTNEDNTRMY